MSIIINNNTFTSVTSSSPKDDIAINGTDCGTIQVSQDLIWHSIHYDYLSAYAVYSSDANTNNQQANYGFFAGSVATLVNKNSYNSGQTPNLTNVNIDEGAYAIKIKIHRHDTDTYPLEFWEDPKIYISTNGTSWIQYIPIEIDQNNYAEFFIILPKLTGNTLQILYAVRFLPSFFTGVNNDSVSILSAQVSYTLYRANDLTLNYMTCENDVEVNTPIPIVYYRGTDTLYTLNHNGAEIYGAVENDYPTNYNVPELINVKCLNDITVERRNFVYSMSYNNIATGTPFIFGSKKDTNTDYPSFYRYVYRWSSQAGYEAMYIGVIGKEYNGGTYEDSCILFQTGRNAHKYTPDTLLPTLPIPQRSGWLYQGCDWSETCSGAGTNFPQNCDAGGPEYFLIGLEYLYEPFKFECCSCGICDKNTGTLTIEFTNDCGLYQKIIVNGKLQGGIYKSGGEEFVTYTGERVYPKIDIYSEYTLALHTYSDEVYQAIQYLMASSSKIKINGRDFKFAVSDITPQWDSYSEYGTATIPLILLDSIKRIKNKCCN